nr:beta-glucosidase 44-like [Ipomoea batatas]
MARLLLLLLVISTVSSLVQCNKTSELSRKSFPAGFVFGTATSAYQVEGATDIHKYGRGPSIWDTFIKIPGLEPNNAAGDVAVDQYHHYKEDIDLLVKLNFDAYRFSISWTRIFPNGTGNVNWKGVDYYNRLINYMLKKGWEDFADYAEFCFKTFGDRVKNWFSFNEPRVVAALGYDTGFFAPGRCSNCTEGNSATEPYTVAHNLILCHAAAAKRYHNKYQGKQNGSFGILLDFVWYEPLTEADKHAAQRARDFHIGWFLHPIVYGEYPKTMQKIVGDRLPKFTHEEVKMVKGSFDYVGINQYTTYYVYDASPNTSSTINYQNDWNAIFACKFRLALYMVPWGLYKAVTYVKEQYGNPRMFIAENGMDYVGNLTIAESLNDTKRINYYRSYLGEVKRAVDGGANLLGTLHGHWWTTLNGDWDILQGLEWCILISTHSKERDILRSLPIGFNISFVETSIEYQHILRRNKY